MSLFINPTVRAVDADGDTLSGARWYFYRSGTSTLASIYSDSSLETEHANPVVADSGGLFAPIYLSGGVDYRAVLKTAAGVTIQDIDPYNPGGASTAGVFYDATANGLVGDGVTDNLAALNAIIALVSANDEHDQAGGPVIWFPPGDYVFSGHVNLKKPVTLVGGSNGMGGAGQATVLRFPNSHGIVINHGFNNNGDEVVTFGGSAAGTILRNLDIRGPETGSYHGVYAKARFVMENCGARGFGGYGVYIAANGDIGDPVTYGNANGARITGCFFEGNLKSGLRIEGSDANVVIVEGVDASYNHEWGIENHGFLGNTFIGCHTSENGVYTGGAPHPSIVNHGGDQYYVVYGSEVAASTTAPGTDSAVWARMPNLYVIGTRGTPSALAPAWVSGTTYQSGGSYLSTSGAGDTVFIGCYAESGQVPPSINDPAFAIGGQLGTVEGGGAYLHMSQGVLQSGQPIGFSRQNATWTHSAQFGAIGFDDTFLRFSDSVKSPQGYALRYNALDLIFDYSREPAFSPFTITGVTTAAQFGRGAAVPHRMWLPEVMLGASTANARSITYGTAAPTTGAHARGEIVFDIAPSASGKIGWVCVTAGTPGTWKAWGAIDA